MATRRVVRGQLDATRPHILAAELMLPSEKVLAGDIGVAGRVASVASLKICRCCFGPSSIAAIMFSNLVNWTATCIDRTASVLATPPVRAPVIIRFASAYRAEAS